MEINQALKKIDSLIKEKDWNTAIEHLNPVLENSPTAKAHYQYAFCLHNQRNPQLFNSALHHYNLAEEMGHLPFWVNYSRGSLLLLMGKTNEARQNLDTALKLKPEHEGARTTRQNILRMQQSFSPDKLLHLDSPVFISTVPKSGTHLLKNILFKMFGPEVILPGWIGPDLFNEEQLMDLPSFENHVYMGHLFHSRRLANRIRSYPKILLIRDPRAQIISHTWHYEKLTVSDPIRPKFMKLPDWDTKISSQIYGISTPDPKIKLLPVQQLFNKTILKWQKEPNHFILRFEDLVGNEFGGSDSHAIQTILELLDFLKVQVAPETIEEIYLTGKNPKDSGSFRQGSVDKWKQEFKDFHYAQLEEAAPGLIDHFGYPSSPANQSELNINRQTEECKILRLHWLLEYSMVDHALVEFSDEIKFLLAKEPENLLYNYFMGIIAYRTRDFKSAIVHFSAVEKFQYNYKELEYFLVLSLIRSGKIGSAVRKLSVNLKRSDHTFSVIRILKKGLKLNR